MTAVTTIDGDMVDQLVAAEYGVDEEFGTLLDLVFAANPALAAQGPVLPAGLVVTLPDRPSKTTQPTVRLWG